MAVFLFNLKYSAVTVMVAALLAALAFALAHDVFYQSLNGKPVLKTQPLAGLRSSLNISDQQIYLSLGTFFAFVKSSLGASVSTVFDQFVWKSIHDQRTRIGIIDDLLSANSSWSVEFYGPTIVCDKAINTLKITGNDTWKLFLYNYLSLAPESDTLVGSAPFQHENGSDTYTERLLRLGPPVQDPSDVSRLWSSKKPGADRPPLSLFVATFPHALEYTEFHQAVENLDRVVWNATILQCVLHNATYQVNLSDVNGDQTVHGDITVLNGVGHFGGVTNMDIEEGKLSSNTSFLHNLQLIESASYQSIMESFGGLLFGSIGTRFIIAGYRRDGSVQSTIGTRSKGPFEDYWYGRSVSVSNESSVLSKAPGGTFPEHHLFAHELQNVPVSNTVNAVPEKNVPITSYHNIYVYTRSILRAACGTAFGVTTLCVAAGILLYFSNDGSYSRRHDIHGARLEDYSGLDPLPGHIANSKLTTGYNPDHPARALSTAPLGHRESAASSQLLEVTSNGVVDDKRSSTR
ncbi:hypothetical protein N7447_004451 [Penicillium robsamsonii]|uniref:uncharacterized protein n=1 Tax=Penicillium robsamsonii TaxID=1792511 RepID=UPI002547951B|nr:uncharacterized protein N7447_004451 [Penicillium robsamsonii]KAJ5827688.1 hypothetical protein N7447_004451 [Penicillium robsamsonii]